MWNIVRTAIIALAFAGFLGQSTARATPTPAPADTVRMASDCAEMMIDQTGPTGQDEIPCDETPPDCIAKMGCTAVSPVLPSGLTVSRPLAGSNLPLDRLTTRLKGTEPPPLRGPPKLRL